MNCMLGRLLLGHPIDCFFPEGSWPLLSVNFGPFFFRKWSPRAFCVFRGNRRAKLDCPKASSLVSAGPVIIS